MNREQWGEDALHFPALDVTAEVERAQVHFERGRLGFATEYYTSGLSPNCNTAFYLGSSGIVVYSLNNFPEILERDVLLRRRPSTTEKYNNAKATLTNQYLAIVYQSAELHKYYLLVLEHSILNGAGTTLHPVFLDMHATCLAMHESGDRTWVTVGGQKNHAGKIQVYCIENVNGSLSLREQVAQFNKCVPNYLLNEWPKIINFSPDGRRLVCVTETYNEVLVWFLSDNARPRQAAFKIARKYGTVSL